MPESTKAIQSLKRAANYSKLAFREFGPKSFKQGQGALLKVIYKFGENGTIDEKAAEKVLDWEGKELRHVAQKAKKNGYLTIADPEFGFAMTLTDKGKEVVQKRLEAESKTADTILEGLNAKEIETLIKLTDKISATCEGLGVDYSVIEKREHHKKHCHCHHKHHEKKCGCHHGHRKEGGHRCKGHHGPGHSAPQYVFVFDGVRP